MKIGSYRELKIWQKGMEIAEQCYLLTRSFPASEQFGLTSQIRRAAASIPANIAEGYGRGMRGEYHQFVRYAQGSLKELETHLLLSVRIGLTTEQDIAAILALCDEEGAMTFALLQKIECKK